MRFNLPAKRRSYRKLGFLSEREDFLCHERSVQHIRGIFPRGSSQMRELMRSCAAHRLSVRDFSTLHFRGEIRGSKTDRSQWPAVSLATTEDTLPINFTRDEVHKHLGRFLPSLSFFFYSPRIVPCFREATHARNGTQSIRTIKLLAIINGPPARDNEKKATR